MSFERSGDSRLVIADKDEHVGRLILDSGEAVFKASRYGKVLLEAYNWNQTRRFKAFLQGLDASVNALGPEEHKFFNDYINSDAGRERLADFAAQAARSRSNTAVAALGILYASNPSDFTSLAAQSLDGISEPSIDGFLLVYASRLDLLHDERLPILVSLSNEEIDRVPALHGAGWDADAWVRIIDDLLGRGMLGPDLTSNKYGSETWIWHRFFRFTSTSNSFNDLLVTARKYLAPPGVLGL